MSEPITLEWLEEQGFRPDPIMGRIRDLGRMSITVGNFPCNAPCTAILCSGVVLVPNVRSREDILTLIRLLDGAVVDDSQVAR